MGKSIPLAVTRTPFNAVGTGLTFAACPGAWVKLPPNNVTIDPELQPPSSTPLAAFIRLRTTGVSDSTLTITSAELVAWAASVAVKCTVWLPI